MSLNVLPLLSERHSSPDSVSFPLYGTPSPVSIRAYNLSGAAGVIAKAILPTSFVGRPFPLNRFHVIPPSVDLKIPLPGPPLILCHVLSSRCQAPANNTSGLSVSITISDIPVFSSTKSVCFHDFPPS